MKKQERILKELLEKIKNSNIETNYQYNENNFSKYSPNHPYTKSIDLYCHFIKDDFDNKVPSRTILSNTFNAINFLNDNFEEIEFKYILFNNINYSNDANKHPNGEYFEFYFNEILFKYKNYFFHVLYQQKNRFSINIGFVK